MFVIAQKIQTRKDLQVRRQPGLGQKSLRSTATFNHLYFPQDKNKKVKVKKETHKAAAIYKFEAKRKR